MLLKPAVGLVEAIAAAAAAAAAMPAMAECTHLIF
jgi:hypothetical protein